MLKSKLHNAAGPRNNYVTIQRATDSAVNVDHEVLPTFTTLCKRFAGSKIMGGREFLLAMEVQPLLNSIIELPYDSVTRTITPRDRIIDDGRTLNIDRAFNEGENNEKIIIWTIEPVAT
jgi:hypothetical protein